MSGRTKVLLVCAVSLGASILRLSAQEVGGDTITGKVHQIEKVTVTARRSPNKVTSAVPIPVSYTHLTLPTKLEV